MARIGIAGGGIAGLYCALKLLEEGDHTVQLFDSLDHLGGRIETNKLEGFNAECGPMRFELKIEPLLKALCKDLKVTFRPFPGTQSGYGEFPKYDLLPQELSSEQVHAVAKLGKNGPKPYEHSHLTTALELLQYGLYKIFHPGTLHDLPDVVDERENAHSLMQKFCKKLGDNDYNNIRTQHLFEGIHLYKLGFWNVLERVLSPAAIAKIRDTGTFYHLFPENPSASEWSIFWLRLFRPDNELWTVKGGVCTIVEQIEKRLNPFTESKDPVSEPRLVVNCRSTVFSVTEGVGGEYVLLVSGRDKNTEIVDHLILAVPAVPLQAIQMDLQDETRGYIKDVIPFPLSKVFAVIEKPWWDILPGPQHGAHLVPTREIHYFPCEDASKDRSMVMLYMDRPGTAYWRPYVERPHSQAQKNWPPTLKLELAEQLARLLPTQGLPPKAHTERVRESIGDFILRDWSEPPFGAACHAWKPNVHVPRALAHLSAFSLNGSTTAKVHICGEAFSDYQGFIEGSLRSAKLVIDSIKAERPALPSEA